MTFQPHRFALLTFLCAIALSLSLASPAAAAEMDFNIPAQGADSALLEFSKQSNREVLFSSDELRQVQSHEVKGRYEPEQALSTLLQGTGFTSRQNLRGKFVVTRAAQKLGALRGRLLTPEGVAAYRVRVAIPELQRVTRTDENGDFVFLQLAPGKYNLVADAEGFQPLHITDAQIEPDQTLRLEALSLQAAHDPLRLSPFVVKGSPERSGPFDRSHTLLPPRTAAGNLDLPRTENDALPYTIYDREQIKRSGVVTLSEFLQRELLDSNGVNVLPNDVAGDRNVFQNSTNLSLRGFSDTDETIILVNGRRLPEMLTADSGPQPPDVNFIPMSLVEQVQVLPVSAAALYSGNPVGGVVNVVLRPDVDANSTEVVATYTNALGDFDAPQKTFSILHSQNLLNGALRIRLNASVTQVLPATESELGHRQKFAGDPVALDAPLYRATPNVRSVDGTGLFGAGTASVTSVAPGSLGGGTLAAFNNRQGLREFDFFDTPGGYAVSLNSRDSAYGRPQLRTAYFVSTVYDIFPWLQLAADVSYANTIVHRGYDVITGDLLLRANTPTNPFGKDVYVSLNEVAPSLGEHYSEGRLDYTSIVAGALVKLPAEWRVSLDAQYAHNLSKYRGLSRADTNRWQDLVDSGRYDPLRDTQLSGPPAEFYDQVLVYRGARGKFSRLGSYYTLDTAARLTNRQLALPTGASSLNLGFDYRRTEMDPTRLEERFGDGTLAGTPERWSGRTLQRYSAFGEIQAPLVPQAYLPSWVRNFEADLAVRYIASDAAREANVAPTYGMKVDFAGGLTVRGSITTSNRLPTPYMSRRIVEASGPGGGNINFAFITDPKLGRSYNVVENFDESPVLSPEAAVTQTAGLIFQRGKTNRIRVTLDFVDTRKTDELVLLDPNVVANLENFLPERVKRAAPTAGEPVGAITQVNTGVTNMAWRRSQHWNATINYARRNVLGGTFDIYGRVLYFQKYERQVLAGSAVIDELDAPSGSAQGVLPYRASIGAGWTTQQWGFGTDAYYFSARTIPQAQWAIQGSDEISSYWRLDAYTQTDLKRWLPWKSYRWDVRAQLRVNNLFDKGYPQYAAETTRAGVQAYGDWRGRTYSLSITTTF